MIKGQKSTVDGIENFLCPFTDMYITQGSNSPYSHKGIMANDVRGLQAGVKYPYYAPCTCKALRTYASSGQVMWQSVNKVRFANGRVDYATFMTVHDNTMDARVGQVVSQGNQLGNMGTKGNATGVHCHIEVSQSGDTSWTKNQYGNWHFNNEYDLDDCYFVDNTNILNGLGGNWRKIGTTPTPTKQYSVKYCAHVQDDGWHDWVGDGETAGTTGQSKRLEAFKIDNNSVEYVKAHISNIGWKQYDKPNKDTIIGTTGQSIAIEDLAIKLDGYKFRVHIAGTGWTPWSNCDGISTLGTVGQAIRLEAVEIKKI